MAGLYRRIKGVFYAMYPYLTEGEHTEVDVPALHVNEPVGCIIHTVDKSPPSWRLLPLFLP